MYAIVEIAGQQIKVEKDQKVYVNRLEAGAGSKVDFDKVLLIDDDGKVQVGMPVLKNIVVSASVISHVKGDKIKIFRKKRRKGFQVLNGHRQALTELLIERIGEGQAKVKAAPKKEAEKRADVVEKPAAEVVPEKKPAAQKKQPVSKTKEAKKASSKPGATEKDGKAKTAASTGKTAKPAAKAATKKEATPVTKKKSEAKKEIKKVSKTTPKAKKNK